MSERDELPEAEEFDQWLQENKRRMHCAHFNDEDCMRSAFYAGKDAALAHRAAQEAVAWVYWHPSNVIYDGQDVVDHAAVSRFSKDTRLAMEERGWKFRPLVYGDAAPQPAAHRAEAAAEPVAPIFLVATGETHEGVETYTRHEHAPPPLCDFEGPLFAAPQPPAQAAAEPVALPDAFAAAHDMANESARDFVRGAQWMLQQLKGTR